ncbi:hypothetical protein GGR52DRAFT_583899 [Hypoxylon sp. FL1284]|nr:hypothetical protein GGR52DRAFT_583899 [Hypoxylon sp. FL1284]
MIGKLEVVATTNIASDTVDPTFPQFGKLPAELRFLIWRFALPRRVFEIRRETVSIKQDGEVNVSKDLDHDPWRVRNSDLVAVLLAPPALLSVCREARRLALRAGSWKWVGSCPRGAERVSRLATWFDPSTDTLCFDDTFFRSMSTHIQERDGVIIEYCNNPAVTRAYFSTSSPGPICMSLAALAGQSGKFFVEQWKRERGFWSGVPQYQFYRHSIRMHLGRSSRVQDIFGRGAERCYTLLVDANDHNKLRQLGRLYAEESDPDFFKRGVVSFLKHIADPKYGYVEKSYDDLRNVWLKGQEGIPPSASYQTDVRIRSLNEPRPILTKKEHANVWNRGIIEDMPKMELVVHFRLCTRNHDKKCGRFINLIEG